MRYVALGLSLLFAACDSGPVSEAEAQGVHISPNRNGDLVFSRAALPTIHTAFVNGPSRTVYLYDAFPGAITLERREGDEWVGHPLPYGTVAVVPGPLPLDPGEYQPLWDLPLFELNDVGPGTYRVKASVFEDAAFERPLPEPQRVSPAFQVTE